MNASFGEVPLRPDHRLFDCFHMRGEDPLVARNQRKERGGLRHGECEVATAVACVWIPDLRSVRQFAVQDAFERGGIDGPRQPSILRPSSEERRGGTGCVSTRRTRWLSFPQKKNTI